MGDNDTDRWWNTIPYNTLSGHRKIDQDQVLHNSFSTWISDNHTKGSHSIKCGWKRKRKVQKNRRISPVHKNNQDMHVNVCLGTRLVHRLLYKDIKTFFSAPDPQLPVAGFFKRANRWGTKRLSSTSTPLSQRVKIWKFSIDQIIYLGFAEW